MKLVHVSQPHAAALLNEWSFLMLRFALVASILTLASCSGNQEDTASQTSTSNETIEDQAARQLSWIENDEWRQMVIAQAKAGQPSVKYSRSCSRDFPVRIGNSAQCFDPISLPRNVLSDVIQMNAHRFFSESDYDQRVTKLYAFRHNGTYASWLGQTDIEALAKDFNVPSDMIGRVSVRSYQAGDTTFKSLLDGLFITTDFVEDTSISAFVADIVGGDAVRVFSFGPNEVGLYPGGGFNATFSIWVTDTHLIYVKREGWDA